MSELPTQYNELLELIKNNDVSVVASIIQNNFTSNYKLEELIKQWEKGVTADKMCAKELEELIEEHTNE